MIRNLKQISTYYEPASCDACGCVSNWGELLSFKVFAQDDLKLTGYKHICPECYKKAVDLTKRYLFEEV